MTLEIVKEILATKLEAYEVEERNFPEGDLGSLLQIEFNNSSKGGNIDLWSSDWFGVFLWDYVNEKELLNVLIDPTGDQKHLLGRLKMLL
ncbi:hypothetical protein [Sphingobacterium multivorum]|uniref:hypothetical protein n=1 Tax=Sphingobacterium multivorum TaxID=28454 RepID=UPI0028A87E35|nr:hypothetical protein [Sphingobacterium multivorum]